MEGIDVGIGVLFDYSVRDDDGTTLVGCADTIKTETSRQACDGTKQTLESFGQVV